MNRKQADSGLENGEPGRKAVQLARTIAANIVGNGMTAGQPLGTIAELSERYGAGAAAVRQAAILLEQQGLIELKRGQGGGASVLRSGAQAAAMVLATHLDYLDLSRDDLFAARAHIEGFGAQLAAERGTLNEALALRHLALDRPIEGEEPVAAHAPPIVGHAQRVMAMAGNPLLALFSDALRKATAGFVAHPSRASAYGAAIEESNRYRLALSEAILSRDGFAARRLAEQWHLSTVPRLVRAALGENEMHEAETHDGDGKSGQRALEREINMLRIFFGRKGRIAEALVRLIVREIRTLQFAPGARLGSENDLLDTYGVARPVLRQALRVLERHGMVDTRQGKAGGIFVGRVDSSVPLQAFRDHAGPLNLPAELIYEAWHVVRVPLVDGMAARARDGAPVGTEAANDGLSRLGQSMGVPIWPLFAKSVSVLLPPLEAAARAVPTPVLNAIRMGDRALATRLSGEIRGTGDARQEA